MALCMDRFFGDPGRNTVFYIKIPGSVARSARNRIIGRSGFLFRINVYFAHGFIYHAKNGKTLKD